MLQHVKTWKKSISKFHFPVKLYEIWKKVIIQNYFLYEDLQIWIATFFHKMYIFLFNLKKYYSKSKLQFSLTIICKIRKKRQECKVVRFNKIYKFCLTEFLIKRIFFVSFSKNTIRIHKSHFIEIIWGKKNVYMENYLPKWGLQILIKTLFDRMYILCFDYKKHIWKNSIFFTKICEIRNKRCSAKSFP